MNNRQISAMWIGVCVTVATFLVPPWQTAMERVRGAYLGFHPLFKPPTTYDFVSIDYQILLTVWFLAALITVAVIVTIGTYTKRTPGGNPTPPSPDEEAAAAAAGRTSPDDLTQRGRTARFARIALATLTIAAIVATVGSLREGADKRTAARKNAGVSSEAIPQKSSEAASINSPAQAGVANAPNSSTKQTGDQVVGRLGVVTEDNVQIVAPREEHGRVLSTVGKGTNITITGETDTYYAVLMIDGSMGLIPKDKVQLLDYEVTASETGALGGPLGQALVQTASGETTNGIDDSTFVQSVYRANGMTLPRTAREQANVGNAVSTADPSKWIPGDRIYFECHHDYIDHTGMYIGNGYFIHSSIGNHGVAVDRIDSKYYWGHLVSVRRSPQLEADVPQTNQRPLLATSRTRAIYRP